jgi:hypothetical protein
VVYSLSLSLYLYRNETELEEKLSRDAGISKAQAEAAINPLLKQSPKDQGRTANLHLLVSGPKGPKVIKVVKP